jgi:hypothetical protein
MQVGEHSEHMRVGFFSLSLKKAREQARPEFRLSEAKSMKNLKKNWSKKLMIRLFFFFLLFLYIFRCFQSTIISILVSIEL